jgi:hypothetical protein
VISSTRNDAFAAFIAKIRRADTHLKNSRLQASSGNRRDYRQKPAAVTNLFGRSRGDVTFATVWAMFRDWLPDSGESCAIPGIFPLPQLYSKTGTG